MDPNQAAAQQAQAMHMMMAMMPIIAIFFIIAVALYVIPLWQICKKAGLSGPLSLLAVIPGIGKLIVLYVVAFSDWKVVPPSAVFPTSYPPAPPPVYPPANYPPQGPAV